MPELHNFHCVACEGGIPPLTANEVSKLMHEVKNWQMSPDGKWLTKRYIFKNFHETMAFVNAVAYIANQEGHHPDLEAGYNYCVIKYQTHAVRGLTKNDFICAAKIDLLDA